MIATFCYEGGLSSFLVTEGDDVDLIVGAAAGTASSWSNNNNDDDNLSFNI